MIPSQLRIHRQCFWKILRIGLPAGIQGSIFSISNVLIQSSINSFGAQAMAGSGSASSIEGFIYIAMNAFYQAALTFTGQNLGAKKPERISRVLRYCLLLVFVTGALLGGTVLFFQDALLGIYTDSQEAIRLGGVQLQIIACSYFLCGMMEVLCGQLRGMGYSTVPMLTSLLGACGLRIVWIYTVFQQSHTLFVLYLSYSVTWVVTLLAHYTCYCIVRRRLLRRLAAGIN